MADGIKPTQLDRLQKLIASGEEWRFYSWNAWRDPKHGVRAKVIKLDHSQCYYCKKPLRPGEAIVHHVQHLTDSPQLALSIYGPNGERQLVTVCKDCHEAQHPEALKQYSGSGTPPVTVERWE